MSNNIASSEERSFQVDRNVIYHLIRSQSGDLESALAELVQNSHDAGATICSITLDQYGFVCEDDGNGFSDRSEIESFFETFGKPHEEDSHTRFGRFRMGRGQIMVHAPTVWASGIFQMHVDIKKNGLNYDLKTIAGSAVDGCRIQGKFYESRVTDENWSSLQSIEKRLGDKCRYIYPMKVMINGKEVSVGAQTEGWTLEDEDVFFRHNPNSWHSDLTVYNLGVLVEVRNIGVPGVLVTKKHLTLNTSRNKVLENCPVWNRVIPRLKEYLPENNKTRFTKAEKIEIFGRILDGEISISDASKIKIFPDSNDVKHYSFSDLVKNSTPICIADSLHSGEADRLLKLNIALTLSPELFEWAGGRKRDVWEGVHWLRGVAGRQREYQAQVVERMLRDIRPISDFTKGLSDSELLIKDSDLKVTEFEAFKAIRKAYVLNKSAVSSLMDAHRGKNRHSSWQYMNLDRKIRIGVSDSASGWTDSYTYIALNRNLLNRLNHGIAGANYIAAVLIHEVCHIDDDPKHHDAEFYERFHALVLGAGGVSSSLVVDLSRLMVRHYGRNLQKAGKRLPKAVTPFI